MKQKIDFITNSSSASFILTLKPYDETINLEEFKNLFNRFLDDYKFRNPNSLRFWDATKIEELTNNESTIFTVTEWVSMYNDEDDVPNYMKELMINSFIKDPNFGFIASSFEINEDGN